MKNIKEENYKIEKTMTDKELLKLYEKRLAD